VRLRGGGPGSAGFRAHIGDPEAFERHAKQPERHVLGNAVVLAVAEPAAERLERRRPAIGRTPGVHVVRERDLRLKKSFTSCNVWSANSAADATKAPLLPRLDVRARQDVWNDKDDISGRHEEGVIELVMSYNLYNGGSDRAERRRSLYQADQALNMRDQTCRDIRQEVAIAYNDMRALEEQLVFLDRHRQAIGRAREAYRRQFDIGQRTLLDMLDTENEFYDAQRAYITAKRQQEVAYTRVLAGMGALVEALELGTDLHPMELPEQGKAELPDMSAVCPPERAIIPVIDKEAIFQEIIEEQADLVRYMTPRTPQPTPLAPLTPTDSAPAQPPQAERPAGW